ncbi:MAG: DUF6434 domain-containing protein [Chitinophagia bacterium]|jgi:hypothetical protein
MQRPDLYTISSATTLLNWYWTRRELAAICKQQGINSAGSKAELLNKLKAHFEQDAKPQPQCKVNQRTKQTVSTTNEPLSLQTLIGPAYKNGKAARKFFKEHCTPNFRFSIPLLAFIKNNHGKTLQDVVDEWHRLQAIKKLPGYISYLPPSLQYNQYIRDFFADNPGKTLVDARNCWNKKRSLPLEKHVYEKSDCLL